MTARRASASDVLDEEAPGEGPDVSYKLLLVEDSPSDARLVIEMLHEVETARFDLARATRLDEALRRISKGGIDCVLLDILLPDSMGTDTFRRLKDYAPDLPIIILSGLGDDEVGDELINEGARAHLVKGNFTPGQLERAIMNAIRAGDHERAEGQAQDESPLSLGRDMLSNILDHLPDPVLVLGGAGGVRYANARAVQELGVETRDVLKSLAEAVAEAPDDDAEDAIIWRAAPPAGGEFEVRTRKILVGRERLSLVTLRPL